MRFSVGTGWGDILKITLIFVAMFYYVEAIHYVANAFRCILGWPLEAMPRMAGWGLTHHREILATLLCIYLVSTVFASLAPWGLSPIAIDLGIALGLLVVWSATVCLCSGLFVVGDSFGHEACFDSEVFLGELWGIFPVSLLLILVVAMCLLRAKLNVLRDEQRTRAASICGASGSHPAPGH